MVRIPRKRRKLNVARKINFDLRVAHGGRAPLICYCCCCDTVEWWHMHCHTRGTPHWQWLYEFSARRAPTHKFLIPPHRPKGISDIVKGATFKIPKDPLRIWPRTRLGQNSLQLHHQIKYIPAATLDRVIVARSSAACLRQHGSGTRDWRMLRIFAPSEWAC